VADLYRWIETLASSIDCELCGYSSREESYLWQYRGGCLEYLLEFDG
jgi:hypothetical protein